MPIDNFKYMTNEQYWEEMLSVPYDFKNKRRNIIGANTLDLIRLQSMFKYTLNDFTMCTQRDIEKVLLTCGHIGVIRKDGNIYFLRCSYSNKLDYNYNPTHILITNPYLKMDKQEFEIGKDCAIIRNDTYSTPVLPILTKYNTMLAENDLTMYNANINSRIVAFLSASDDRTRENAQDMIDKVKDGELKVIGESNLFDENAFKVNPMVNGEKFSDLIEFTQYINSYKLNILGLDSNYNMKRQTLNSSEVEMNESVIMPYVNTMLDERKQGLKMVNELFDTDYSVEFTNVWKNADANAQETEKEKNVDDTDTTNTI